VPEFNDCAQARARAQEPQFAARLRELRAAALVTMPASRT